MRRKDEDNMKNKYDGFDTTFNRETDSIVNAIEDKRLNDDRARVRDCLMYLKKSSVSDTQKYGMLLFLRKFVSDEADLKYMSVEDFTNALEEYEKLTNSDVNKKVMMKGIEDRMEGNDE